MIILSDTNIISSFAAAGAFPWLLQLFRHTNIHIPPAVQQELQAGLARGKTYLEPVLASKELCVLELSEVEKQLAQTLPAKLNRGECEAIALAKYRGGILLSNDKRAIRYCDDQRIEALDLVDLLRLLWLRQIISQREVQVLIDSMSAVENLTLTKIQWAEIFASPRR
jgi:predicted nucleic acid-binding protein